MIVTQSAVKLFFEKVCFSYIIIFKFQILRRYRLEPSDQTPTPLGVNFINILCATFALIFLCQKITKPKYNKRKAAQNTFIQKIVGKMLMKLTLGIRNKGITLAPNGDRIFVKAVRR
jgi:hypothetical protein